MSEPWAKARAPIDDASGPTWMRTSEKSAFRAFSIFTRTGSGIGWPTPLRRRTVSGSCIE